MDWILRAADVTKNFLLHTQGGIRIPVLENFSLELRSGEAVVLTGPSGAGKSTLLRLFYGNYRLQQGSIQVLHQGAPVELSAISPGLMLELRRWTMAYVSQFLRVIPRVPALRIVMEPLLRRGIEAEQARRRAQCMLERLRVPTRLWALSPTTFSGGEQQRINLAHGFIAHYPVVLLDEPTASLDASNRDTVLELIAEAREKGSAVLGIFHDQTLRARIGARAVAIERAPGLAESG